MTLTDSSPMIEVVGARVHNLKNLSVQIPLGKWTCITGISGAGKSSLAFDTIHAEGQRRYVETLSPAARLFLEQMERPEVDRIDHLPPAIAVRPDHRPQQNSMVAETTELLDILGLISLQIGQIYCPKCEIPVTIDSVPSILQQLMSWPSGTRLQLAVPLAPLADKQETLDAQKLAWEKNGLHRFWDLSDQDRSTGGASLQKVAALVLIDRLVIGQASVERLSESLEQALAMGNQLCFVLREGTTTHENRPVLRDESQREWSLFSYSALRRCTGCLTPLPELEPALFRRYSSIGGCLDCAGRGEIVSKKGRAQSAQICPTCAGTGLNSLTRNLRLPIPETAETAAQVCSIQHLLQANVRQLTEVLQPLCQKLETESGSLQELSRELQERLNVLQRLGLASLELNRLLKTLSGGERQRITLAGAVCSQLVQTLYVLDEPSHGLHPLDCREVKTLIEQLRDRGNTVISIDHEAELIRAADHLLDLGPAAGSAGGEVVFSGTYAELLQHSHSVTARWLSGEESCPEILKRPLDHQTTFLTAAGIRCNNLQDVSVAFPLQQFSLITGVSGSGKTTLLCDTLHPALVNRLQAKQSTPVEYSVRRTGELQTLAGWEAIDQCVLVNDVSIGGTSRSTVITYLKAFDDIRKLFAETVDAQSRGYTATRFSFNSAQGGRCSRCAGMGEIELDLHFLGTSAISCPECKGKRFNQETLDIKYRLRNIHDVLMMTTDEAFVFFRNHPTLQRKLQTLRDVGLGYVSLGQPTAQLSEGELQRLKLASFLTTATGKHVLYLFDEPASGLHPADVVTLMRCFRRLVEQGHSVIAIDHHPLLIHAADWIVDLGPGAAEQGGQVLFAGPLAEFSTCAHSPTAQYYFPPPQQPQSQEVV